MLPIPRRTANEQTTLIGQFYTIIIIMLSFMFRLALCLYSIQFLCTSAWHHHVHISNLAILWTFIRSLLLHATVDRPPRFAVTSQHSTDILTSAKQISLLHIARLCECVLIIVRGCHPCRLSMRRGPSRAVRGSEPRRVANWPYVPCSYRASHVNGAQFAL